MLFRRLPFNFYAPQNFSNQRKSTTLFKQEEKACNLHFLLFVVDLTFDLRDLLYVISYFSGNNWHSKCVRISSEILCVNLHVHTQYIYTQVYIWIYTIFIRILPLFFYSCFRLYSILICIFYILLLFYY